ncbi:MAG: hypothetical protein M5U19_17270 [Microthrixaceae bacterium]|nr:hypothetical protein [Microthrixaceae bacterium]
MPAELRCHNWSVARRGEIEAVRVLRPVFDADLPLTTPADRAAALVGAASAVVSHESVFEDVSTAEAGSSNLVVSTRDSGGTGDSDGPSGRDGAFLVGRVEGDLVTPQSARTDLGPLVSPTAVREVGIGDLEVVLGGSPREGAAAALAAGNRRMIFVAIGSCAHPHGSGRIPVVVEGPAPRAPRQGIGERE